MNQEEGGGERVQEGRDHQRAESIQQQQEGVEHVHEDIRSDEEGGIVICLINSKVQGYFCNHILKCKKAGFITL